MEGSGGAGDSLVGRQRELAVLDACLDALSAGSCQVVVVVGEPGIGKTRLLSELGLRAGARHDLVLCGRAAEFERDTPFGPFVAALDDYLETADRQRLNAELGPQRLGELSGVFPALAAEDEMPVGLQEERYRAHRAVRVLLETVARPGPVVVALDDLHWADPASIELACHLLVHRPAAPVLLALAFRPAQVPSMLSAALESVTREGHVEWINLEPLSSDEAALLIGDGVDVALRDRLYGQSGGNPFYLQQLARATVASGPRHRPGPLVSGPLVSGPLVGAPNWVRLPQVGVDPALDGLSAIGVPGPVRAALASELAALSGAARTVLAGAAVAGDMFEPELAAAAAGMSEAEALVALDELLSADLVRGTDVPRRFRFRHPIVRQGVYESSGAGWQLGAHARAASALEGGGAAPSARAHHVVRSAKVGNQAAIDLLAEAGRVAAPGAPAIAAQWYLSALRLVPDNAEPEARLGLLVAAATALGSAGELEESRRALARALESLPAEAGSLRVRLLAFRAGLEHLLGQHIEAHDHLAAALEGLSDPRSAEAAGLQVELAVDSIYTLDFPAMQAWASCARDTARTLGERALGATASALLGFAEYILGSTTEAARSLDEAAAVVDSLDDGELAARLDAAYYLGWAEHFMERYDDAIRHLGRGMAASRLSGQGHLVVPMMLGQVFSLAVRGRLAEAADLVEAAIDAARLSANRQSLSWALWLRCYVATQAGDIVAAVRHGQEGVDLAATIDDNVLSTANGWIFAAALLESGEAQRCRDEVLRSCGGPDLLLVAQGVKCVCYELLARAELALGRADEAAGWADRAAEVATGLGLAVAGGAADRARALVLLQAGDAAEAGALALAAAQAAGAAGAPIESARSRILAGRALARAGDKAAAVAELERAEDELADCGALRFADEARRELARLGRRRRPRTLIGDRGSPSAALASLTAREIEVAELVGAGRTNRQIGTALFLSEKTVESHLSHIFTKLGTSSRAGVATLIARRPLETA